MCIRDRSYASSLLIASLSADAGSTILGSDGTSTVQDCAGTWGGTAVADCAGTCNGTAVEDCAGVCGGDAVVGGCDNTCGSTAVEDCAGVCGGDSLVDVFGHCDGGNSLQNAIDLAVEGSTLDIPVGTYVGPFSIDKSLTLNGADQNSVFIENVDISTDVVRVCYSSGAECDVTIQNVTIRNGRYVI